MSLGNGTSVYGFRNGILENWDELCALHERESPSGRAPDLRNRMKELLGEKTRI